uniref:Receptor ligand binding region domain-containing protein n=1 Tax=Octopus bimaculoides TaxID=37653 RepID=A0A0L8FGS4_OCTBM
MLGDLNIGCVISLHHATDITTCGSVNFTQRVKLAEAVKFAVEKINRRSDILNRVKLGYVILDDCTSTTMALARSLQFMPRELRERGIRRTLHDGREQYRVCKTVTNDGEEKLPSGRPGASGRWATTRTDDLTTTTTTTTTATDDNTSALAEADGAVTVLSDAGSSTPDSATPAAIGYEGDEELRHRRNQEEFLEEYYDVIGVVGADTTKLSLAVASILTIFQIPQAHGLKLAAGGVKSITSTSVFHWYLIYRPRKDESKVDLGGI